MRVDLDRQGVVAGEVDPRKIGSVDELQSIARIGIAKAL